MSKKGTEAVYGHPHGACRHSRQASRRSSPSRRSHSSPESRRRRTCKARGMTGSRAVSPVGGAIPFLGTGNESMEKKGRRNRAWENVEGTESSCFSPRVKTTLAPPYCGRRSVACGGEAGQRFVRSGWVTPLQNAPHPLPWRPPSTGDCQANPLCGRDDAGLRIAMTSR